MVERKFPTLTQKEEDELTFEFAETAFELIGELVKKDDIETIKTAYPRAKESVERALARLRELVI